MQGDTDKYQKLDHTLRTTDMMDPTLKRLQRDSILKKKGALNQEHVQIHAVM